jgi:hypothetical protein
MTAGFQALAKPLRDGGDRLATCGAHVYDSLPSADRRTAVIFTGNYGQAGAVNRFRGRYGLPTAYSGQNAFRWWGPPPATAAPVIVIGDFTSAFLHRFWRDVTPAARNNNHERLANEEQGMPIWVWRDPVQSWRAMWKQPEHFD